MEDDLRDRAITFAREIAITMGSRRDPHGTRLLHEEIRRIQAVRQNVLQLDILAFGTRGTDLIATSHPDAPPPFTDEDVAELAKGEILSRLVTEDDPGRYWEVMVPVTLEGRVAGAVAAKFSLDPVDRLAARVRFWAFTLTAASVAVMGGVMGLAVTLMVDRPLRRFTEAIARIRGGETGVTIPVRSTDELGVLAVHFNDMLGRIHRFNDELRHRVTEATAELDQRYQEVQRLNELLFGLQRSLSHAERLALSGRIMAQVAHEVGTPLHSVAGHLELLRRELPPALLTDGVGRRLTIVEAQVTRVTTIIAQLLDLTRRSPGDPVRVDVNGVVQETVDLVRPGLAGAGLTLDVEVDPDAGAVCGYPSQIQQVVLNLLTNAIDATPPGGRVAIATRAYPRRDEVAIEVTDTGCGIPAADQKRIFEPFVSTKAPGHGSGLGLFISAQIVRDHRGRLEVQSEEGKGSTFRVVLAVQGAR